MRTEGEEADKQEGEQEGREADRQEKGGQGGSPHRTSSPNSQMKAKVCVQSSRAAH